MPPPNKFVKRHSDRSDDRLDSHEFKIAGELKETPYKVMSNVGDRADAVCVGDTNHTRHALHGKINGKTGEFEPGFLSSEKFIKSMAEAGCYKLGLELQTIYEGPFHSLVSGSDSLDNFTKSCLDLGYKNQNEGQVTDSEMLQSLGHSAVFAKKYGMLPLAADTTPQLSAHLASAEALFTKGYLALEDYDDLSDEEASKAVTRDLQKLPQKVQEEFTTNFSASFFEARLNDEQLFAELNHHPGKPGTIYGSGHDDMIDRLDGCFFSKNVLVYDVYENVDAMHKSNMLKGPAETAKGQPDIVYLVEEDRVFVTDHGMDKGWIKKAIEDHELELIDYSDHPIETQDLAAPAEAHERALPVSENNAGLVLPS